MEACVCHAMAGKFKQFATVFPAPFSHEVSSHCSWMLTKKKNYRYDERLYSSFSTGQKMMEQLILMHFL